ncbi:MAG: hypothetical protein Q9191_002356 [Dirinaria sp. TL-2023a]
MGCCGEREKLEEGRPEQKWSYITLSDFKATSWVAPLSYGVLYISLLISIAVYAVDIFTAANLLFFDRWSGQVKPVIPFTYARWVFAGCIILSWVLLVYRWMRAVRVIRSGVVAASYLDPLAVRVQSVRMGKEGRGWRRFLLFAALTKGRKGAEYVALFTYFSFEAWLRIVFAEGPRQIINAVTLYTVMQAKLVPVGQHAATGSNLPVGQFFINIRILAASNREQATILFGMLFTLIIWLFSALGLALAILFYVVFLWHHIPSLDGTLARYCRRKVDKRLSQIVGVKINKAIERENKNRMKGEVKSDGKYLRRQPTIPDIDDEPKPSWHSSETSFGTESRSNDDDINRPSALPGLNRPTPPSRMVSQASASSNNSYCSDAPLMDTAGKMGYDSDRPAYSPGLASAMPSQSNYSSVKPGLGRLQTQSSQISHGSNDTAWSGVTPVSSNQKSHHTISLEGSDFPARMMPVPSSSATARSFQQQAGGRKALPRIVPERDDYEMQPQTFGGSLASPSPCDYVAYNPVAHAHPSAYNRPYPPRSTTAPPQQYSNPYSARSSPNYFGPEALQPPRSGTAPIQDRRISTSAAWASQKGVMDQV